MFELRTIVVDGPHCIGEARREVVVAARALGFDARAVDEIAIIVTELATNLARYTTRGGVIRFQSAQQGARRGLEIVSEDTGPGIADVARAMENGFSTGGSLGQGLGAVKRLADVFDIHSRPAQDLPPVARDPHNQIGTVIIVRKWLALPANSAAGGAAGGAFVCGVFSRPHPAEQKNGDGFFLRALGEVMVAAVFDGLGHGPEAHAAANATLEYLETHFPEPLDAIVRGLHLRLRNTRGAVLGLARLDIGARTLSSCSVGNIEARVLRSPVSIRPISYCGTLGAKLPRVEVQGFRWFPGALLVLASDGISTKWDIAQYPGLEARHPSVIADTIFRDFARAEDDATIVVIQWLADR